MVKQLCVWLQAGRLARFHERFKQSVYIGPAMHMASDPPLHGLCKIPAGILQTLQLLVKRAVCFVSAADAGGGHHGLDASLDPKGYPGAELGSHQAATGPRVGGWRF